MASEHPEIFYCLFAVYAIKWMVQSFFIFRRPFRVDGHKADKLLHVVINTFVTIPFRDLIDETRKSKSSEMFWNMVVHASALTMMLLSSSLVFLAKGSTSDRSYYGFYTLAFP